MEDALQLNHGPVFVRVRCRLSARISEFFESIKLPEDFISEEEEAVELEWLGRGLLEPLS